MEIEITLDLRSFIAVLSDWIEVCNAGDETGDDFGVAAQPVSKAVAKHTNRPGLCRKLFETPENERLDSIGKFQG
jgi:hypothetical protein